MGKFYGEIGYAETSENPEGSGIWVEVITEINYTGDVIKNNRRLQTGEGLNDDVIINNMISIIADPYASQNFINIRYVKWMGVLWKVTNVEVQRPRLILTLGGVYNVH